MTLPLLLPDAAADPVRGTFQLTSPQTQKSDKGASIKYVRTEGEGGRWPKCVRSKGGCVNSVLQTWPKCVQGVRGGKKSRKICVRTKWKPPYYAF